MKIRTDFNKNCIIHLSIYLSICLSIYLFYSHFGALAAFSVSWSFTQSVGILGRGISPSQGRCQHTEDHKHRINADKHPCVKWDSNLRPQCFSEQDISFLRPRGHWDRRQIVPQEQNSAVAAALSLGVHVEQRFAHSSACDTQANWGSVRQPTFDIDAVTRRSVKRLATEFRVATDKAFKWFGFYWNFLNKIF
jgi:hypothetical protein